MYRVRSLGAGIALVASLVAVGSGSAQVALDTTRQIPNRLTLGALKLDQTGQQRLKEGSAPGAQVLVAEEGRFVSETLADQAASWPLMLPEPLPSGAHRAQVASRSEAEGMGQGEFRQVTMPGGALRALTSDEDAAVERARAFADEATRVLDEIMPVLERNGGGLRVAQASTGDRQLSWSVDTGRERDLYDRFFDWLDRSARQYSSYIVRSLASGTVVVAGSELEPAAGRGSLPRRAQVGSGVEKDLFEGVFDSVRRWFDKANKDYQGVIVRNLSDPPPTGSASNGTTPKRFMVEATKPGTPAVKSPERFTPSAKSPVVAQKSAEPEGLAWIQDRVGRWFSRSNKDYNDIIVKQLSEPTGGKPADLAAVPVRVPDRIEPPKAPVGAVSRIEEVKRDDAARLAEIERERAQRAEAQRLAELKIEEERKLAAVEAAQRAEAARKANEEQERQRLAALEAAQRAEVLRREEQERQKAAEDVKRLAATEAARREEQQRQQKAAEEARKSAATEAARLAASQRAADEAERRRVAEAERRQAAERAQADATRRAEERARQVAATDQTVRTPRRAAERSEASSRIVSAPRRVAKSGSAARRAYAKDSTRARAGRRSAQVVARVQRARSGPAIVRAPQPAYRSKARVRSYCRPGRTVNVVVPRVVVVDVRGGVYQSVFERDYDRRRIVVAYNSPLAARVNGGEGCGTTLAIAP